MSTNLYLEHHGIKGMKWGIRRNRDSSTRQPTKRQVKAAERINSSYGSKNRAIAKTAAKGFGRGTLMYLAANAMAKHFNTPEATRDIALWYKYMSTINTAITVAQAYQIAKYKPASN